MNKKLQLFEHIKTVILVVLFFTTILLLYLCLNQSGNDFSISDIIPGGRTTEININLEDYTAQECLIKSKGSGKFELTQDKEGINQAVNECAANLLSSSSISIEKIESSEFEKIALEENSVIAKYSYEIPLEDFCKKLIGKTIESEYKNISFDLLMYSNTSKEFIYILDSENNCYKLISGENYYSTDRIQKELETKNFVEFKASNLTELKDKLARHIEKESANELEYDSEKIAQNIFGDTFDFIRKITDSLGNETYLYGYGEKRLSVYANGDIEFKEDVAASIEKDFYKDLETALIFIARTIDLENNKFDLTKVQLVGNETPYFKFNLSNELYNIELDVKNSKVSYFSLEEI